MSTWLEAPKIQSLSIKNVKLPSNPKLTLKMRNEVWKMQPFFIPPRLPLLVENETYHTFCKDALTNYRRERVKSRKRTHRSAAQRSIILWQSKVLKITKHSRRVKNPHDTANKSDKHGGANSVALFLLRRKTQECEAGFQVTANVFFCCIMRWIAWKDYFISYLLMYWFKH